jgi:ribosomal protein S15P/S13E
VLLVALGGVSLAWVAQGAALRASENAKSTAQCVNSILATRNRPSAADARSQISFAESVLTALTLPSTLTPPEQQAALTALVTEVRSHVNTLIADQKARDSHPLGKC